jgi:hypothetical protein
LTAFRRPGVAAGLVGMVLVAALYIANALVLRQGGGGLSAAWLLLLAVPGVLASYLSSRRGTHYEEEKEGALAGLLTAHFAAALQVLVLVAGVLNIDWTRFAAQAGPQVAQGVRDVVFPAALVAGVTLVAVTYTGCITANWLAALACKAVRSLAGTTGVPEPSQADKR